MVCKHTDNELKGIEPAFSLSNEEYEPVKFEAKWKTT